VTEPLRHKFNLTDTKNSSYYLTVNTHVSITTITAVNRKKIADYVDSHIKHVNTLCEQMQSFADQVVYQCEVITVL